MFAIIYLTISVIVLINIILAFNFGIKEHKAENSGQGGLFSFIHQQEVRRQEAKAYRRMANYQCPKCKSDNFDMRTESFSKAKAIFGAVLWGNIGIMNGVNGKDVKHCTCTSCGTKWRFKN